MLASIFVGLAHVSKFALDALMILVFLSAAISLFNGDPYNPFVRIVRQITEPMYRPFRRFTSRIEGPIDFAPMFVLMVIYFLKFVIPGFFMSLAHTSS